MKKNIFKITALLLFVSCSFNLSAQINRTIETKVADILAQMPTDNLDHSNKVMEEIIGMGGNGILKFTDMLVPLGTGDDTKVRYALQSVAIYSGGTGKIISNGVVENALLQAIKKASNDEVKTFLIDRLLYCGTAKSVAQLSGYLTDDKLYKPALAALESIGTTTASKAILDAASTASSEKQLALINTLGKLEYEPATDLLLELATSSAIATQEESLRALASIGAVDAMGTLVAAANNANYRLDNSSAIISLIAYGNKLADNGNKTMSNEVVDVLLKNCKADDQLHFRSAAVHLLRANNGTLANKTLLKESLHKNKNYSAAVIDAAAQNLSSEEATKWVKNYKKASTSVKPLILNMMASREEAVVYNKAILPAVSHKDQGVRIAGIKALAHQDKSKVLPVLLTALNKAKSSEEFIVIEETLSKVAAGKDASILAKSLSGANGKAREVLVNVLAARDASAQFGTITGLLNSADSDLKATIYKALPSISGKENLSELLVLLEKSSTAANTTNTQNAISAILISSKEDTATVIYDAFGSASDKSKLTPILATLSTDKALELVAEQLNSGTENGKKIALDALSNWKTNDAIALLFKTVSENGNQSIKDRAFGKYLDKVLKSVNPDDQKLLLVTKLLPFSNSVDDKKQLIKSASRIKTFLSLIFVSKFLDDSQLLTTASNAAIQLALPTPGKENGLSGDVVRDIVSRSVNNLTGPDSQYVKIDVKEFLEKMPKDKGFVSIFNGKDLSGWEGLVKNPIARGKMSEKELAKEQAKANAQMLQDWYVKDGVIGFKGEGYNNICTIKDYADFEMLVDWKITNGGDSGIYLRGTPQVQIWDIARVNVGAQVGSGGLYNNQKHQKDPLVVADNPINEWNTFRIKMVGDRVTIHLNGVLVTDNVILENYWDREQAIFAKEAIELQAHGEDLGFRNVYVREIPSGDDLLTDAEKSEGFKSLFNGKDLGHWIGNKKDYLAENGEIAVKPKQGGHGNLYTANEYSDFVFRFEFKLTPGANNGLGIHAPLQGDAAYEAKELQILDNTAAIYANLEEYQYHGSVYGVIAAKRGFLNPVGEWNSEEVIVKGDAIKITLNGTVILEGSFKEASKNGTLDGKNHPGLDRNNGHIGFLGHGSELWFRNIRIKDLAK